HAALTQSLGRRAVDNIFERALAEITPAYARLNGAEFRDGSLILDSIGSQLAAESEEDVRAAFSGLYAAVLVLLSRMVGKEVALRLARNADAHLVLAGDLIGKA